MKGHFLRFLLSFFISRENDSGLIAHTGNIAEKNLLFFPPPLDNVIEKACT